MNQLIILFTLSLVTIVTSCKLNNKNHEYIINGKTGCIYPNKGYQGFYNDEIKTICIGAVYSGNIENCNEQEWPSERPSSTSSDAPSNIPSTTPTYRITDKPSVYPTLRPSERLSLQPTLTPTASPTIKKTVSPTINPTEPSSEVPSLSPTYYVNVTICT